MGLLRLKLLLLTSMLSLELEGLRGVFRGVGGLVPGKKSGGRSRINSNMSATSSRRSLTAAALLWALFSLLVVLVLAAWKSVRRELDEW